MDKEMLQLVQGACKADNLQRALDVARLMHHSASIEAAAKVAAFYHLPGLQERIQDVKGEKEKEKREKKREATRASEKSYRYSSPPQEKATSRQFTDFAPRTANRRSFAGAGVNRDSTPAASYPPSTFIPETPGLEVDATPAPGIEEDTALSDMKRKREKEVDDFAAPSSKKIGSHFSFDKPASQYKLLKRFLFYFADQEPQMRQPRTHSRQKSRMSQLPIRSPRGLLGADLSMQQRARETLVEETQEIPSVEEDEIQQDEMQIEELRLVIGEMERDTAKTDNDRRIDTLLVMGSVHDLVNCMHSLL